jgi:hypothetical protein
VPLPFDRVVVLEPAGPRSLSLSDFLALPLAWRVRALLEKRVEFYKAQQRVSTELALRALRERAL